MVSGAIRTDFILSAEIMVIALNEVDDEPFVSRAVILVVVAIAITLLVYGVVALIVKMDDIGLAMTRARLRRRPEASGAGSSPGCRSCCRSCRPWASWRCCGSAATSCSSASTSSAGPGSTTRSTTGRRPSAAGARLGRQHRRLGRHRARRRRARRRGGHRGQEGPLGRRGPRRPLSARMPRRAARARAAHPGRSCRPRAPSGTRSSLRGPAHRERGDSGRAPGAGRRPPAGQAEGEAARSFSSSGPAASSRKACWCSPPTWTSATSVKPASHHGRTASTTASRSGPQGIGSATSSGRTNWLAPGEAHGRREVGVDLPAAGEPAELLVGPLDGRLLGGVPADRDLPHGPGPGPDGGPGDAVPPVDELLLGLDGDEVVGQRRERLQALLAAQRDGDVDAVLGHVPQPGRVDVEVLAAVGDEVAGHQLPDDLDGLAQHVLPGRDAGPALADDVLVEVLAAAEAQGEAALGEELEGRGLLRDDGRVVAHRRAGHVGHEVDPARRVGDGAEDGPRVRRVALLGEPGGVVVARDEEVEAGVLGAHRGVDELAGAVLLGHQGEAEAGHGGGSFRCGGADPAPLPRSPRVSRRLGVGTGAACAGAPQPPAEHAR